MYMYSASYETRRLSPSAICTPSSFGASCRERPRTATAQLYPFTIATWDRSRTGGSRHAAFDVRLLRAAEAPALFPHRGRGLLRGLDGDRRDGRLCRPATRNAR